MEADRLRASVRRNEVCRLLERHSAHTVDRSARKGCYQAAAPDGGLGLRGVKPRCSAPLLGDRGGDFRLAATRLAQDIRSIGPQ
jgi:hypothetical protein